jgi:uncharacterized protein DUF4149
MNFFRYIMSLSLVAWVGGIVFFVSMTPILFAVLPSRHLAGSVVSPALSRLHWIGMISGVLFLASSWAYSLITAGYARFWTPANVLVLLMLTLTCVSQFGLSPRLAKIRAETPIMVSAPTDSAPTDSASTDSASTDSAPTEVRVRFDALHQWSTRIEGGVLLLGLIAVYLVSKERVY